MNGTNFGIFYKEHFESPVFKRCDDKFHNRNTIRFPLILPKTYLTRKGPLMLYSNGMALPKLKLSGTKKSKLSEETSRKSKTKNMRNGILPPLKQKDSPGVEELKKDYQLPTLKAEALPSMSAFRQSVLEYRDKSERKNGAFWEIVNGKYKSKDSLLQHSPSRINYTDRMATKTRSSLQTKKTGFSLLPVPSPMNSQTPANSRSPSKMAEDD